MNQLVLSGTATLVPSGTRPSCYRGPESDRSPWPLALSSRRNSSNQKSFGFLLTDRAFGPDEDNHHGPPVLPRHSEGEGEDALSQFRSRQATRTFLYSECTMNNFTEVELLWLEKRIENRIRFGHSVEERILDRRRRVQSFAPGSIFAFVRWTSNDFGTAISRIDILRAVAPGQRCSTVPYVKPGGDILLRLSGWPKVERVLQLIDAVEALDIDPADAAPDYWHHVHNRMSVNENPRPYTKARHQAWLQRQRTMR